MTGETGPLKGKLELTIQWTPPGGPSVLLGRFLHEGPSPLT